MRYIFLVLLFQMFLMATAVGDDVVGNARDLREFFMAEHRPLKIEVASSERGCGPVDCSIDIDGLSILRERQLIQQTEEGSRIQLQQHWSGDSRYLPEIDWEPIAGFKVFWADQRLGTCLEFSHTGLGKSGDLQRWISIVLVPWKGSRPYSIAHRFVGYWAGCDFLLEGVDAGEILLPIIELGSTGSNRLHIVWYHCRADHCIRAEDSRTVSKLSGSENGALLVHRK